MFISKKELAARDERLRRAQEEIESLKQTIRELQSEAADDLLGGIHDTLRQIRGVAHHPLRPKRMACQQHRCQQAEAYSPSHRTGA